MSNIKNMERKTVTLNNICISFVEDMARVKQISQSEVLRRIIENYIENHPNQNQQLKKRSRR